ncbi:MULTISPECIES: type I-E CRISPR-associated protein Cse1/CasA [Streptomyces]|uniref:type I-E CRISPR-associated protein Cse1/CasA n=1 Tax=Streptomyces TaxID=1883 RepID=UPI002248807F|nr:type I-E CRISPR-associated protein Cse1/CasA [Streptomyces sp. JHD 1]MCX2969485.1 type I-E CRISPR-associated protein Cse1/CasA [Streptomyces sp. JHD 1]
MFHPSVVPHPIDGSTPFARLSPAALTAWAKHDRKTEGWLPLWRHMADSAGVAGKLWEHWVPRSTKELISESLPGGERDASKLLRFLAAAHDSGKATPAFACQVEPLADRMRDLGLGMPLRSDYGLDRRLAPHALAGQLLLQEWMAERFGLAKRASGQLAVVAGGHHGTPPEHQQIHDLQLRPHLLRHPGPSEEVWRRVQYELMDGCADLAGVRQRLPEWGSVRLPQPAQVILTALVIMSDWIASAPELFPYDPDSWQPVGPIGERRRLQAAWNGLDLPTPWAPALPQESTGELFAKRFPKLRGAKGRPVQEEAVHMARSMPTAGLLMIEAPMGEGKTEAALAAAEILAARTGAGGLLIALPTRATSDAMFSRLMNWVDQLPQSDETPRSVVLAHAKAALNDRWAGLLRKGRRSIAAVDPGGEERLDEVRATRARPAELHAHQWLRGRKKQLLASFAVGTIDQVLLAALKSRHLALRHLAVAGKVVVIDEVHAYDAYMGRYLDRALEWLAAYRVPVVLLSATLPAARRRSLAAAYAGSGGAEVEMGADAYPLITAVTPDHPALTARPASGSGRRVDVMVERLDDDVTVLADRLAADLAEGGCALIVRNTVDRVLEAAEVLRKRFGDDAVTVAHSRFLAADRAAKDIELLQRFGPGNDQRPEKHVVVASQVVEQSLDVDFDLLVTDLAPVDLVLQRMGRLHRHPRRRPPRLAQARCLVTGVDWSAKPSSPVKGSLAVYQGAYTLLRSLAVLGPHLDGSPLRLPSDISPLVQRAYGEEEVGPESWAGELDEARVKHLRLLTEKREKAEGFLLDSVRRPGRPVYGWLEAHAGDADDSREGRAQVRDSEQTLEVLVVQRRADGRLTTVPWLDGGKEGGRGGLELPTDFPPSRRAAEAVAASALTLPGRFGKPWLIDRTIEELERFLVPAWQVKECPWLAGELLLVLDERCQTRLAGFDLAYSPVDGLRVTSPGVPANNSGPTEDVSGQRESGPSEQHRCDRESSVVVSVSGTPAPGDCAGGESVITGKAATTKPSSFDLVSAPWLPVQRLDGKVEELSLLDVFAQADDLRRLVGDVPTQELALLRLLLAIVYDALDGPAEIEDWEDLWLSADPFSPITGYLDRYRERFDLLHPVQPFYQVAELSTAKNELGPLSRIVADVPVGNALFSMRRPGVDRLAYAEAARWLVHTHAYDTSGIKSAMVGDEKRAKAGKVYPLGVGSLGNLGGVFAEGSTLRETLLLNLIAFEDAYVQSEDHEEDLPVWRRPPLGPAPRECGPGGGGPSGLRDLYTWQSRRVRMHSENGGITGVVLGYGDPLALSAPWKVEPMSGWRRSPTQEKKQGRVPVYTPRPHDPSRAAWRGLGALLPARQQGADAGNRDEPAAGLRPGVAGWFAQVITSTEIAPDTLIRLRLVGAVYGTQQSVVDEIVDDSVVMPVITLHEGNPVYGAAAVDAVHEAESAVAALGQLAGNLARAAGTDPRSSIDTARDLGFGTLDGPYRAWLEDLLAYPDLPTARQEWRNTVRRHVSRLARQLLASAGPAANEGRMTDLPGVGVRLMDAGRAHNWFTSHLNKVLAPAGNRPTDGDRTPH